ncbi:MAG: cell envelope integrity protein TolA [Pseudomonadota bacterium]
MSYTISNNLVCTLLLTALATSSVAAESAKPARDPIARQATAADINRAFELLEQEVLAEELAAKKSTHQTQSTRMYSAESSENAGAETELVAQHMERIRNLIASNWIGQSNTRTTTPVIIHMRLAPNGRVITSAISQSSGDRPFDYSVVQAVEKTERFQDLQQLPASVFERNFRDLNLLLRHEDLSH